MKEEREKTEKREEGEMVRGAGVEETPSQILSIALRSAVKVQPVLIHITPGLKIAFMMM